MNSLEKVLANTQVASKHFPELVDSTEATMKKLRETATTFNDTAKIASKTLTSGQVAINSLSQQLIPSTQQVLQHLGNIEVNLQSFTAQLKRNPAMIVRGKVAAPRGPGE